MSSENSTDVHNDYWIFWHCFVPIDSVTLESHTELRTIRQFGISGSSSIGNWNLSVIHELDRNTWRLLNWFDIFFCKKSSDTLILYTTLHNLSFWNPWKLEHLNRTQSLGLSVNFKFLEVSAVKNYDQYVSWKLDGRSWLILNLIDILYCKQFSDTWIAHKDSHNCHFEIPGS